MADKQTKKLSNMNFYGVSYDKYDNTDVSTDIITNIRKRFLVTKKPASNKLYRSSAGVSYVYSYNFSFERPLQWRVTKNKRVIEEIIPLNSGKYCVNFYDENGRDIKKVFFDAKHRWFKTNYYSDVDSGNLACSIVPKESDYGTVILKYVTGEVYPQHLYPGTVPSCDEVRERLLSRIPTPIIVASTDLGIVYYVPEEDRDNYEYILAEEERAYAEEHSPQIYISQEDIKTGFNLDVNDFDTSRNINRTLDISLAQSFDDNDVVTVTPALNTENIADEVMGSEVSAEEVADTFDDGSVEAAISIAVDKINRQTSLNIDTAEILNIEIGDLNDSSDESDDEIEDSLVYDKVDIDLDKQLRHIDSVLDGSSILTEERKLIVGDSVVDDDYISSIIDGIISSAFVKEDVTEVTDCIKQEPVDETISDETVSQMIDEELSVDNAREVETVTSYESDDATVDLLADTEEKSDVLPEPIVSESDIVDDNIADDEENEYHDLKDYVTINQADSIIESRGESYFYYGSLDESGRRSGRGRTLMSDGSIAYEGDYLDDKRKGTGSFYYKDGSLCYWGNWDDNVRSGFGVGVNSEDKSVHIGNWQDNKPKGTGVRFDEEGNLMFLSSSCEDKKKGITISDITDTSFVVRVWSEKDDAFVQQMINISDIIK